MAVLYIPSNSTLLQEKFINYLMKQGKKTIARHIFKDTLEEIRKQGQKQAEKTFEQAIENVKPNLEVKAKRIGGSVYQIPIEVSSKRQMMLSFRWMIQAAKTAKGGPMSKRLAKEIMDAANNTGAAMKKKEDTHRMAQANRAFAHYARY